MNIEAELKAIEKAEKAMHKAIDDETNLEKEIISVAEIVANNLENNPFANMEIQNRSFLVLATLYNNPKGERCISLVAREKSKIVTPQSTVIKADLLLDEEYSKRENLVCGIKALLGHITGLIKPEVM